MPHGGGENCRRLAAGGLPVFTGGNKRGQDTVWFPVPSCLPSPSFALRLPAVAQ